MRDSSGPLQEHKPISEVREIPTAGADASLSITADELVTSTSDIGHVTRSRVSLTSLTSQDKLELLKKRWKPDDENSWPYSERRDGNKIRKKYLGPQHISENIPAFHILQSKRVCSAFRVFSSEQHLLEGLH